MIDLHLHTTASDGRLTPEALVARAAAAGITILSVTDHDTLAGLAAARRAAEPRGLTFIDGIEITAVHDGRDVHMLGYFVDPADSQLQDFLQQQRHSRVERVREMAARLSRLGLPIDVEPLLAGASQQPDSSVGRPVVARALVDAGHVPSIYEAFERFLAAGQPAFVPRRGRSAFEVVEIIHAAGGLASMAHPGVTKQPSVMAALAAQGLDGIEIFHSDHDAAMQRDLLQFATDHKLLVTGGSDFHGDDSRDRPLGSVTLPLSEFERLAAARRPR